MAHASSAPTAAAPEELVRTVRPRRSAGIGTDIIASSPLAQCSSMNDDTYGHAYIQECALRRPWTQREHVTTGACSMENAYISLLHQSDCAMQISCAWTRLFDEKDALKFRNMQLSAM
eukprot:6198225-Pleurochrysis_carterae.AAC.3